MKIGLRTPSPTRSFKARTTGKMKRRAKAAFIPGYGKKGMGWIKNPKKAAYNKVYNKTTVGYQDLIKQPHKKRKVTNTNFISIQPKPHPLKEKRKTGIPWLVFGGILLLGALGTLPSFGPFAFGLCISVLLIRNGLKLRKIDKEKSATPQFDYTNDLKLILIPEAEEHDVRISYSELINMAIVEAENRIRISKDCVEIIQKTKDTSTFFGRFNLLIENLQYLSLLENHLIFTESSPTSDLEKVMSGRTEITNRFFDRVYQDAMTLKTENGRKKRIERFKLELTQFNKDLSPENIQYLNSLSI